MEAPIIGLVRQLLLDGTARAWRESAHLSRADLARDLGVDEGTVARWEAGQRVPRRAAALRLGELLGELAQAVEDAAGAGR